MAYSDFQKISDVQEKFSIDVFADRSFFRDISEIEPTDFLKELLAENIPLALNINTEKARSELMIMPILVAVRKMFNYQISLFAGTEFTVDKKEGLNGYCDYILSGSSNQIYIQSPVVCMVEGKNENLKPGYPQCIAEMIAAQRFNTKHANSLETHWGVVTTGSNWKFLRLVGKVAEIDYDEYQIAQVAKLLGIFHHILTVERRP